MPGALEASTRDSECYRARRYAVKINPPCIFLEYEDASKKRRVRAVKLNGVQPSVDVDRLTKKVIRSFPRKLEPSSVKYDQVRKLVVRLLEFLRAPEAAAASTSAAAPAAAGTGAGRAASSAPPPPSAPNGTGASANPSPSGNGSRRSSEPSGNGVAGNAALSAPLPAMSPRTGGREPRHGGGRLAQSGSGVVSSLGGVHYHRGSIESTMSRFSTSTGGGSSDEGGSGGEEGEGGDREEELDSVLDELSREMGTPGTGMSGLSTRVNMSGASSEATSRESSFSFRERPSALALSGGRPGAAAGSASSPTGGGNVLDGASPSGSVAAGAGLGGKSRFAVEAAEKLVIGLEVTEDLDLNKVTDLELRAAKQAMEADFRANQLRPGDPGYVYDKQAEFGPPTSNNDWDEDSDGEGGEQEPEDPVDWAEIKAAVSRADALAAGITGGKLGGGGGGTGSSGDMSSPTHAKGDSSPYNSNDWP